MKRRDLIKSIGFLSFTGASALLIASCGKPVEEKQPLETIEPEKTEREKLIINRTKISVQNPDNPSELELKHTAFIEVKEKDDKGFTKIDITLGSKGFIHPTENDHWIDYIKLFHDNKLIATTEFEIGAARGFNSFLVKLEGVKTIKVEIGCNMHGIWENSLNLT